MLIKTKGIVIKSSRYSESSLIVRIYTQSHGMLSFHIPGVYSPKSTFKPAFFQSLQIIEMDFYFRPNKNLLKLKEVRNTLLTKNIQNDIRKSALIMIVSEILYKTIKEEEKNEDLFDFCMSSIVILDQCEDQISSFLIVFLAQYTRYIGFYPSGHFEENTPYFDLLQGKFASKPADHELYISANESHYFNKILRLTLNDFQKITIPFDTRQHLLLHLISYYEIHISGFTQLSSYNILSKVFTRGE